MLKVEYLGRIEYDFQKYRVTGPWDHKDSVSAKQYEAKCHVCVPFNFAFVYLSYIIQDDRQHFQQ
jgi:hypothetical protein